MPKYFGMYCKYQGYRLLFFFVAIATNFKEISYGIKLIAHISLLGETFLCWVKLISLTLYYYIPLLITKCICSNMNAKVYCNSHQYKCIDLLATKQRKIEGEGKLHYCGNTFSCFCLMYKFASLNYIKFCSLRNKILKGTPPGLQM